jgi:hypothetical protein
MYFFLTKGIGLSANKQRNKRGSMMWIEIQHFNSFDEALKAIMPVDKSFEIVRHELDAGEVIEPDVHDVDEWILINEKAICRLQIEDSLLTVDNSAVPPLRYISVMHVPRGKSHSFHALSHFSYFVLKSLN